MVYVNEPPRWPLNFKAAISPSNNVFLQERITHFFVERQILYLSVNQTYETIRINSFNNYKFRGTMLLFLKNSFSVHLGAFSYFNYRKFQIVPTWKTKQYTPSITYISTTKHPCSVLFQLCSLQLLSPSPPLKDHTTDPVRKEKPAVIHLTSAASFILTIMALTTSSASLIKVPPSRFRLRLPLMLFFRCNIISKSDRKSILSSNTKSSEIQIPY